MAQEHRFSYKRQGRYFASEVRAEAPYLVFVLHGYGQHPRYFLRRFEQLQREDIHFVAPEGLHRFYLSEQKDRVGSSWMTREDRKTDMEDYLRMLEDLAEVILENRSSQPDQIGLLGFSQGVATACRWLTHGNTPFDVQINWAGAFPPDLPMEKALLKLRHIPIHLLAGTRDPYLTEEALEKQVELLRNQGLQPQVQRYEGAHRIEPVALQDLTDSLFPRISSDRD